MFFSELISSSSVSPRQPFKKQAAVHEWSPSLLNAKSEAHKKEIFDIQYRTYRDTDTLSIYFAKASPGVISHSAELVPGILVDYTETERVVCIDIDTSMDEMPYHLFDVPDLLDSKPPFVLQADYDSVADRLALSFEVTPTAAVETEIPTEDPDIFIGVCSSDLWRAVIFKQAHKRLLVPTMGWEK